MEFKSSFKIIICLFLFAAPYFTRGESDLVVDTEIYEIDYRGPETHSSIPPPDHSHRKPQTHRESSWGHPNYPKSKGSNLGRKANKIHG
ncbi:hypothetical protein PanWU01x14_089730 [Parasponia andersonii]|uniref:Transmembrane protein n=1 Tax=Parasponia andersonii TaxID=3476 RepID=A0A2P5D7H2_PARAD|nr:hypothetical protein PanWU01x14_089730 [Parasponia andersonii]